jgi:signal transduction histidine kinase/ligand-binding sensor domain-containing protein
MKKHTFAVQTLFCLCCLMGHSAKAQEFSQFLFDNYTEADGLSSNDVHATLRDKKGFLWIATSNGLNRFDGYSFKTFQQIPGDSTSIGDNLVYALAEDSKGFLWVGTGNGLYRYDPKTERFAGSFLPKTIDSSGFDVKQMYLDSEECLWMGSSLTIGLLRYDTRNGRFDRFVNYAAQKFGGGNIINDVWKDKNNLIWVATGNGFFTFNPATGKFKNALNAPLEKDKQRNFIITSVLQDRYQERRLWLTTWGDGLWKYDKITGNYEQFLSDPQLPYDGINNVLHDLMQPDSNSLWLGATQFMFFDISKQQFYDNAQSLGTGGIHEFQPDTEGNIWMAGPVGFARLSLLRQQFGVKKIPDPLAVWAILKDTLNRKTYFGTAYYNRAIVIYDETTGDWKTHPLPLLDKLQAGILKLLKDRLGMLWLLTGKGLFRYDEQKKRIKQEEVFLKNGESSTQHLCFQAEQDPEGNIYFRFDNGNIVQYLHATDVLILTNYKGDALGKTKDGSILLASKKGITQLPPNGGKALFITFPISGMAAIAPIAIAKDFMGQYWIGTQTNGILILKPGKNGHHSFRRLGMEDGLPSPWVHHLDCDTDGNVWVSTRRGLVKIDPASLKLTVFKESDGLITNDFFPEPVFLPSGEAFISSGGSPLYHHFNFREVRQPDLDKLSFHFHTFRVAGKPVVFEKNINDLPSISLNYPDNAFSVEFAALAMDGQKNIHYAYRLAGLEEAWTDAGKFRYAAYTNLPPGNYCLEVRMSNQQGAWSENIHSLNVVILPAWWQRAWVRALAGLLLVGLVSFGITRFFNQRLRRRVAKLERQQELENVHRRIAQDLHDDLGSEMSSIALSSFNAARSGDAAHMSASLENIAGQSQKLVEEMRDIVWSIHPENDTLEKMVRRMRQYASNMLDGQEIALRFEVSPDALPVKMAPEARKQFYLIYKEAMNNLARYAHCTEAYVDIWQEQGQFVLEIRDNGAGFDPSAANLGNGLRNMRNRAEALNGALAIESSIGQGTLVRLRAPLNAAPFT